MNAVPIVVTGGVASGKSTVTRCFEQLGVTIVDADLVAREVVAPGAPALTEIAARWGESVLAADGSLDRGAMRERVFADPAQRQELEAILHPRIRTRMRALADTAAGAYVLLAIPLFVESGDYGWVRRVLLVDVPESMQRSRLMQRDGSSARQVDGLLAAQASRAARWARADDVLINDGPLTALEAAVRRLHNRYLQWSATAATEPASA
ncbi:MAG: dephospho-CoA kinase [Xanthomonadales bacterium]|nr:dephospho-CoA kinase [Xanthomonadales bacterium]